MKNNRFQPQQETAHQWPVYSALEDRLSSGPSVEPSSAELILADSAPVAPKSKNRMTNNQLIAVSTAAAVAMVGGGIGLNLAINNSRESVPQQAAPAGEPQVPAPNNEANKSNEVSSEEAMAALKKVNIDLANGIVTILAAPNSGARVYKDSIGNKEAVVGPDLRSGTKDDETKAPESALFIDTDSNMIVFLSAQEFGTDVVTGKPLKDSEFSYASGAFEVNDEALLDSLKGKKLTLDDFRQIFTERPDALTFQRLEVESRFSHSYEVEKNVLGELMITDTNYDSDFPILEVAEGDADFKKTLLATSDAADTTILELQASWVPEG